MKKHKISGILFSEQYLSIETINHILEIQANGEDSGLATFERESITYPQDPETAFEVAWSEFENDPEFQAAIKEGHLNKVKSRNNFIKGLEAELPKYQNETLKLSLSTNLTINETPEAYIHLINEEPVLIIPKTQNDAGKLSAISNKTLYAIFIAIDVIAIIAAVASVTLQIKKGSLAKSLQKPLAKYIKWLHQLETASKLEQLTRAGKKLDIIVMILTGISRNTNLRSVLTVFLASMSLWARAAAILQLVAITLLVIGTAGASLAIKILQLTAAIAILVDDIISYSNA